MAEYIKQKIQGGKKSICDSCTHRNVCKAIDNQPCTECNHYQCTADVEPVKRGRWLTWEEMFPGKTPKRKNNLGVFCDQCRNHADNMSDYCPNCGAKMDEEVDT